MPVLETHSEHKGHWCGSWNHHEISHLGHEFKQNWKLTSCLTVQFSFPGLSALVIVAKFHINSSVLQTLLCRTFNVELCTFWSTHQSESSLQKGKLGTASLPWGILAYFPFQWQVVSISFQELLSHFMTWSKKEKIINKSSLYYKLA